MRRIEPALAARIESGAARLCFAWIVGLKDGRRLGFTDHDRALEVDSVVCSAASGWTVGAAEAGLAAGPGTTSAAGVIDDAAVTAEALDDGDWDGARVELWRVDWAEPALRVRLWAGTIARVVRTGERFTAEVEGPLALLERVAGRTYGRRCDAALGDARCRADVGPEQVCDKRWRTCVDVFGNGANFRGFPHIPGDDFLTAYPAEGGRHDGGRR